MLQYNRLITINISHT